MLKSRPTYLFRAQPTRSRPFWPDEVTDQCPTCLNEVIASDLTASDGTPRPHFRGQPGNAYMSAMYSDCDIDSLSTPNTDWEASYFPPLDEQRP